MKIQLKQCHCVPGKFGPEIVIPQVKLMDDNGRYIKFIAPDEIVNELQDLIINI